MKLGGIGTVDLINRAEQVKAGSPAVDRATGAKALASSHLPTSPTMPKAAPRSSNSSKETAKDFSTVLRESETKSDANQESLALTNSAQRAAPVRVEQRPENVSETREATTVESDQSLRTEQKRAEANFEPGSIQEKIGAIAESLEETAETELSMRHLSMRDFLAKMKEEFGIEPKSVVNAFAKLDAGSLMAPPEETATAVLAQLGLKPEQMPKAQRIYREMLDQTGESALSETLAGVGAGVSLKVLSEQDLAMDKLQKSILGLNDAFARRNENPELAAKAVSTLSTGANGVAVGMDEVPVIPDMISTAVLPQSDAIETVDVASPMKSVSAEQVEPETSPTKSEGDGISSKFASIGAALSSAAGALSSNSSDAGQSGSKQKESSSNAPLKPKAFDSIESALATTKFDIANMSGERAATPLAAGTATSAALASALTNSSGDGTTTNAQDLVRHAQILVKNGGGEMKMQLKPEGVGDVTLKVAVKDGQVQIQMMTETDSAKKVLESNLDDLKTSLAQHKLHVDAVKIEIGGEMAKQRFEQAQQDANREQTRQLAQDFMNQFRQDREGFRQGFSGDMQGFRNYGQSRKNPLPEMETVGSSSANKKSSGDRRLNLVA